jgi:hypothetical protein
MLSHSDPSTKKVGLSRYLYLPRSDTSIGSTARTRDAATRAPRAIIAGALRPYRRALLRHSVAVNAMSPARQASAYQGTISSRRRSTSTSARKSSMPSAIVEAGAIANMTVAHPHA